MRYPAFLAPGETIGFVAPSFGAVIEPYHSAFQAALSYFHALGYPTECGPNVYENSGIGISSTPERCGSELTDYYTRSENRALISTGGGEMMCEILPYVDFERIAAAAPKWYMGYSDNTNFTFLLPTLCDTAAIYGPCASEFGMQPPDPAVRDAFSVMTGEHAFRKDGVVHVPVHGYDLWEKEELKDIEHPYAPYNLTEESVLRTFFWDKSPVSGRLIGGCMDCLVNLLGTSFDKVPAFLERYKEDGIIWFLESCDLNVFAIRRAMWQMKHAGWFRYTKAFLIGRPLVMGQEIMGLDQYRAVTDIVQDIGVPVIMDADIGHLSPMMPLIPGAYAEVSLDSREKLLVDMMLK